MSLKRSCEEGPDPKRTCYQEDYIVKSEPTSNEYEQLDMQFVKVEPPDVEDSTENLTEFPLVTVKSEPSDAFFNEDDDPLSSELETPGGLFQPAQTEQTDDMFYYINIKKTMDSQSKNVGSGANSIDTFLITCYRCCKRNITVSGFKDHLKLAHKVACPQTEMNSFLQPFKINSQQYHQCSICNGYLKFNECDKHVRDDHKVCRICQIPVTKSVKEHHVCEVHFTRIFHCTICYKECTNQGSMLKHFTREHPTCLINFTIIPRDTNSTGCPYCFYSSTNMKSLMFHVKLHERKKCGFCKKWFLPTSQHIGNFQLAKCLNCEYNVSTEITSSVTKDLTVQRKTNESLKPIITVPSPENDDAFSYISKKKITSKMASGKPIIYLPSKQGSELTKPVSTKDIVVKTNSGKPLIVLSPRSSINVTETQPSSSEKSTKSGNDATKIQPETSIDSVKKICIIKKQESVANPKTISIISKGKKLTLVPKSSGINAETSKARKVCIVKSKSVSDPVTTELNKMPSKPTNMPSRIISIKQSNTEENVINVLPLMSKEYMPIKPIVAKSSTNQDHTKITIRDLAGKMTSSPKILVKTTQNQSTSQLEVPKICFEITPNQSTTHKIIVKGFDGNTIKATLPQDTVTSAPKHFIKLDKPTSLKLPLILPTLTTGNLHKGVVTKVAKPIDGTTVVGLETRQPGLSPVKHILIKSSTTKPQSSIAIQPSTSSQSIIINQNVPCIQRNKIKQHGESTIEVPPLVEIKKVTIPKSKRPNVPEFKFSRELAKKQNLHVIDVDPKESDSGVVKYPCNHCSKLLDLSSLNQHIRLDHFFCGICKGTFDNFMYLQKHYQTCTLKSYKCWICDQVVADKMELKIHTTTQHLNCPPDTRYQSFKVVHQLFDWSCIIDSCPYCLKSLSQFLDVNHHLKMDHEVIKCENEKCSAFKVQQEKCRQCV